MRQMTVRSTRSIGLAVLLAAPLLTHPALADTDKPVNGFKPITRALTPGERAAAQSYARPGDNAVSSALALSGGIETGGGAPSTGFSMSVSGGNLPVFADGYGARRSNQLLGDGQIGYDAEPFFSNNRSYYTPYGYTSATPRLNYNESFLRHLYGGNIAGAPSVSAPTQFWDGRR